MKKTWRVSLLVEAKTATKERMCHLYGPESQLYAALESAGFEVRDMESFEVQKLVSVDPHWVEEG